MSPEPQMNIQRLLWCCEEHNLSPDELGRAVGISQNTLNQVLDGEKSLSFKQLQKLGRFFNRGPLFLLDPNPINEALVYSPQFRTIANQKSELDPKVKAIVDRAEKKRDEYLSLLEDLDEEVAPFDPPRINKRNGTKTADAIRSWLNLGEENSFASYREAVEAKGVLVFRSNGYAGDWQIPKNSRIMGFSLFFRAAPIIVIKKQNYEARQSFTLFHELGHLLLHRKSFIDDDHDFYQDHSAVEQAANAFAGRVLIPDHFLAEIDDNQCPDSPAGYSEWLSEYKNRWGVSTEVILRRLMDNNRFDPENYRAYREWNEVQDNEREATSGSRQWRYREPRHLFGRPFVNLVLDALNNNEITLTRASHHLDNIKIKDIRALEGLHAGP